MDGEDLWIAGGGVRRYDTKKQIVTEYHNEDGLISNGVTSVAIDAESDEIWFGTSDGVSKLDKKTERWQSFDSTSGLAENWVQAVSIIRFKKKKSIWFGTQGKGITVLNPDQMTWRHFEKKDGLTDNCVNCIVPVIDQGLVLIGTSRGINTFNLEKENLEWTSLNRDSHQWWINHIIVDEERGTLWCLTRIRGIKQFDMESNTWNELSSDLDHSTLTSMVYNRRSHILWVGTKGGLYSYHLQNNTWKRHPFGNGLEAYTITALLVEERDNQLWCSTDRGICTYDLESLTWDVILENNELAHNFVYSFLFDERFDSLWIATEGGGVNHFSLDSNVWQAFTTKHLLPSNLVRWLALSRDKNSLWIGTRNDGVGMLNLATKRAETLKIKAGLPDNIVSAIQVDKKHGYIWIGFWGWQGCLCRYDPASDEIIVFDESNGLPSNSVTSISSYKDFLWVGTSKGIACYDTKRETWKVFSKVNGRSYHSAITVVADEEHNAIWAGTERGADKYDIRSDTWESFTPEEGLAHRVVLSIAVDGDLVWFGTEGKGVSLFDTRNRTWKTFTTRDGLANNIVMAIAVDKKRGHVWFGTAEGGISRLNKRVIR